MENPQDRIDNSYLHHAPHGDQTDRYVRIREAGKQFALTICACVRPEDYNRDEFDHALHYIDLAIMMANATIARYEIAPSPTQN
jgi:hypothetical protein